MIKQIKCVYSGSLQGVFEHNVKLFYGNLGLVTVLSRSNSDMTTMSFPQEGDLIEKLGPYILGSSSFAYNYIIIICPSMEQSCI